ncbi:MAG: 1-deoxy-D-xylulose-5-phosphate synthase [Actinobacteria bacterium]|nr:1-deoxy-D-xylulose-5-phosphate synthase [Actinomycetota bacterium]
MSLIARIRDPRDVRALTPAQLPILAAEIRAFLVAKVSATGGHLGPNLGVVELTIALHRVFHSPDDAIIWDTGHQSYVHKILTGRAAGFDQLRQPGGISGYPSRAESAHDIVENSHASTSLSYADGLAKAWEIRGLLGQQHVVAIIGDGGLTGGMAWEALNNIAGSNRQVVIVVNDNERSYSPTIGGLAHHLSTLRTTRGYERFMQWGKRLLHRTPLVGSPLYGTLHGMKKGVKDIMAPQGMFEDLGLKYIGPVDGHDESEVEHALTRAKDFNGPVIVHVITEKGRGYGPAEADDADRFHAVGIVDPDTGIPLAVAGPTWTGVFSDAMLQAGRERDDVVAITAAMLGPTGLDAFSQAFPHRTFDVGIAEQHAATSAAGMAFGGLHPVVALYATFLNRAFDQILMDCALHKAGVTFVLDRAGVTGDDGATHNGVWDLSLLQIVPGLRIAAPRDEATLRAEFAEALLIGDAPTVVRYPKGALPPLRPALRSVQGIDILAEHSDQHVLIISVGAFAELSCEVADRLQAQGIGSLVVDPRWVKPVPDAIVTLAKNAKLVVVIEDGLRTGGVGSAVSQALRDANIEVLVRNIGIPDQFLDHGKRADLLKQFGLSPQEIARSIVESVSVNTQSEQRAATAQVQP